METFTKSVVFRINAFNVKLSFKFSHPETLHTKHICDVMYDSILHGVAPYSTCMFIQVPFYYRQGTSTEDNQPQKM